MGSGLGACLLPQEDAECCPIAEISDCEEEKPEEGPTSNGELRLWDYRLLKVFFVL